MTICDYCIYCSYTVIIGRWHGLRILIDHKSGTPIYEQIYSQIKAQIISGALREDEMLPSIRNLAKDLRVSVITSKRAYDELERDGFLYTAAGKGSFVAVVNPEMLREENRKEIEAHLKEAIRLAQVGCVSAEELAEMLRALLEGER